MEAPSALALALVLLLPLAAPSAPSSHAWQIIEYEGPISQPEQVHLRSVATELLDFVPPFGYLVRLSAREELAARGAVVGIRDVPLPSKTSADLTPEIDRVRVLLFPDADPARVAADLRREGAAAFVAGGSILDVTLGSVAWTRLAARDDVRWVEPLRDRAVLDNERASGLVQGGDIAAWPVHERGIDGSSQLVAYCDTGLDTDAPRGLLAGRTVHEQFADPSLTALLVHNVATQDHRKVALYYTPIDAGGLRGDFDDPDAHGTYVAGTLAGDAGVWGARDGHDGVAYAAKLVVCDVADSGGFHVLSEYAEYWEPAYEAGARVHSNSWGTAATTEYALSARQHDAYVWEHRDFLILRSMGNTGPANAMQSEGVAKNVLTIGATINDPTGAVWASSSRGPANDGRIKPDLVAPGACVTSAWITGSISYRCLNGTSSATPTVAGAAALVRDYFAKGFYPTGSANASDARAPSAALVRATLVASAVPIASSTPDGAEGWGRPELERALAFDGDGTALLISDEEAPLETGQEWAISLDVAAGSALRIALAWTDHPAAPGASPALVNDLDLEIVLPNGIIARGNANLAAPDRANVIERVFIENATAGTHMIRVRGWNVPMGPQPFGLVVVKG